MTATGLEPTTTKFVNKHSTSVKIKDEKLSYNISREAAKISTLSSGKIDKYEYLTNEETLPLDQRRMIAPSKFKNKLKWFKIKEKSRINWIALKTTEWI